jgi:hypothetical protein
MGVIEHNIIRLLQHSPGLSDRELANSIKGHGKSSQYVNQKCRALVSKNILLRKKRKDGLYGNWLVDEYSYSESYTNFNENSDDISEKKMKQVLENYLTSRDWEAKISWRINRGVDIEANRGANKWIIEVKGSGFYSPVRNDYFLTVLGEILQRMDNPNCKYSIALPDVNQFHRLWDRLPSLAKNRTGVTALFVSPTGQVIEAN